MLRMLVLVALVTPVQAGAQDWSSVNYMRRPCAEAAAATPNTRLSPNADFCLGLAAGASQVLYYNCELWRAAGRPKIDGLRAELPMTFGAGAQAFANWAAANPDKWSLHYNDGMIFALMEAFPCRN